MKSKNIKNIKNKPLTLDGLSTYNQEVLFPFFEKTFVTKKEFGVVKINMAVLKTDTRELKTDVAVLKTEFKDFKNEILTNEDAILKKLDILLTEKEVREYQEEKQKRLWAIIIKVLKEHRILSSKEMEEIAKLEIF